MSEQSIEDPIVLNLEVAVKNENGIATVCCPEELRITERVASILKQAVTAKGLELKKWVVTQKQREDLVSLSNVILEE